MRSKRKNHFKSALSLGGNATSHFTKIIAQQRILREVICQYLPDHFSPYITSCIKKDKTIIIYTTSATWASQLRFLNQPILAALHANGKNDITETKIRVLPEALTPEPQKRYAKKLSDASLNMIHSNAVAHTTDSELSKALLQLHKTLKNKMS
ncbi:MAG: DciA family protein [Methylococcales bacterium]|jgi:hypothetical protein|nr:DUF721 domain-containing protein [Methylococcaceae bacterium]HIL41482.1 DUF721 domain-containing protein [Methylococcales bacterium]